MADRASGGANTADSERSGSGRGDPARCALKLSPESAARAEQRQRGRRSGSSSPTVDSPTASGAHLSRVQVWASTHRVQVLSRSGSRVTVERVVSGS